MDSLHVVTSRGPVSLIGRLNCATPRPSLLVIGGAFPPADFQHELVDRYLGANVLIGRLPGMDAPWLQDRSPETASAAFDEAIARLLPNDPLVVYGISTGCLVSLGLKAPNLVHHILDEPFFSTAGLWPVVEPFRRRLEKNPENQMLREFLWSYFGLSGTEFVDRPYSHLIDGLRTPADAVVGGALLEPEREMPGWPSLTSSSDRATLMANPLVTLHVGPESYGHVFGLTEPGQAKIGELTLRALRAAASTLAARERA
ncbi:MAG: hypothetical protein JWQ29_121 [Phenylobacterium sp.]|nr:hypothetical protein [Phenylobacterium sp.]